MGYPFIKARWFTATNGRQIDWIVVHDMEAPETAATAENVARMFATTARQASAHYNVDNDSIVQSVLDKDVAYHAPGANAKGIGIEHAGYASQRPENWDDAYSRAMLARSAVLVRELTTKYGIPVQFVDAAGLRAGKRGITTHAEVSKAWGKTDHTDPGPHFPMGAYLQAIRGTTPIDVPPQKEGVFVVNRPPVALMPHPQGYWEVTDDGGVFTFGQAPFFGSTGGIKLNSPIVDAVPTQDFGGYWLVAADGGVFAFGNAKFLGSAGGTALNKPIKSMAVSADGQGYYLMAEDGGIFGFGSARYLGRVEYSG